MVCKEKILLILKTFFSRFPIPVFLVLVFPLLFTGCGNDLETVDAITLGRTSPHMSAKNVEVTFSDSGKIEARLNGVLFNRYSGDDPYLELPKGFKIQIYDSAMRVESTITGNYGKRRELSHIMEARGNVIVRNEILNRQLNTEHLIWDEARHKVYSDVNVKFTTPDKVLYGQRFESNENFTNYKIIQVKAVMTVKKDSI
jgi:LPS export ABC transporter protein LptC